MPMRSCTAMFVFHAFSCQVEAASESRFLDGRRSAHQKDQEDVITCPLENANDCIVQALAVDGVVIVSGIPGLSDARESTFHALATCAANPNGKSMERVELDDGTVRLTLATRTLGGSADPLDTNCQGMQESSHALREVVDAASHRFLHSLESLVRPGEPVLRAGAGIQYRSLLSVAAHGEQLEHFHVYRKTAAAQATVNTKNTSSPAAIEMHTDAGMLLSMVPAMLMTRDGQSMLEDENAGLYVRLASGSLARVVPSAPDAMVFMVGSGWVDWINPSLIRPLRAAPHKLIMPHTDRAVRCWYGRMYLPAADAKLPPHQLRFADVRAEQQRLALVDSELSKDESRPVGSRSSQPRLFIAGRIRNQSSGDYYAPTCMTLDNKTGLSCWLANTDIHFCRAPSATCSVDEGMVCIGTSGEYVPNFTWAEEHDGHCVDCTVECQPKCGNVGSTCGGVGSTNVTCCDGLICTKYSEYFSGCAIP